MPDPAPRPWPRPIAVTFLAAYVVLDLALWLIGFYELFHLRLEAAGQYLTLALVLMLLAGWAWRWWVARGWIGGRPTARFGGGA